MYFLNGGGVINWASHKQEIIAHSSTQADFVSASEVCRELMWHIMLLEDFGIKKPLIVQMLEDYQSCIALSLIQKKTAHRQACWNLEPVCKGSAGSSYTAVSLRTCEWTYLPSC